MAVGRCEMAGMAQCALRSGPCERLEFQDPRPRATHLAMCVAFWRQSVEEAQPLWLTRRSGRCAVEHLSVLLRGVRPGRILAVACLAAGSSALPCLRTEPGLAAPSQTSGHVF